ncbi:hypothetical protein [Deinococcus hohokamensis]|uniref:Uncharacterized protein n=1 Tax=Deinococcus hohokamensis TaxID=309883 RepID=A0ABV9IBP7_9DEIO
MFEPRRKDGSPAVKGVQKAPPAAAARDQLPPARPPVISAKATRVPPQRRAQPSATQHRGAVRAAQRQAVAPLKQALTKGPPPAALRQVAVKASVPVRSALPGPAARPAALSLKPAAALRLPAHLNPLRGPARTAFAAPKLNRQRLKAVGVSHRQALKQAAGRRKAASALASAFLKRNRAQAAGIGRQAQGLGQQIQANAARARRRVLGAAAAQQGVVRAGLERQKARARARAASASAQVAARHASVLAALPGLTQAARAKNQQRHAQSVRTARTQANTQKSAVRAAYAQVTPLYAQAGTEVGQQARARAETQAQAYESHVTGKDDSFLDGPLTDNRWKARAGAARDVGGAYQPGFRENAEEEARRLTGPDGGLAKDLANIDVALQETEKLLTQQLEASNRRLTVREQQARAQAQQAYQQLSASIRQQLAGTLSSLSAVQSAQISAIAAQAQAQAAGLQGQAGAAQAALNRSAAQIARGLDTSLAAFDRQVRGAQAPDPAALRAALGQAQQGITRSVQGAQLRLRQGLTRVTASLSQGASQAEQGFGRTARAAVSQGAQSAGQFDQGAQGLVTQALTMFQGLQKAHQQGTVQENQATDQGMDALGKGLEALYARALKGLPAELRATVPPLKTALEQNFAQEDASIRENAEKAAAQVQPRWKSWVKIALMIAVIIVVAVVAGPAVIGAVGAMAGALGAGAAAGAIGAVVGGALIGAASGVVLQMGNNMVDNIGMAAADRKSIFDGVGKAALIGAAGGALGGAGGLIAGKLGSAGLLGSGLTQKAAGAAVNTFFDLGGNVMGDLMSGASLGDALKNLTNPEALMMLAIGSGVGAAATRLPGQVGQIQTRAHAAGEQIGAVAGDRVNNVTGNRRGVVPTREHSALPENTTRISGYDQGRARVDHSSSSHPQDVQIHQKYAVEARADTSVPGQLKNRVQRLLDEGTTKVGGRRWELEIEARKHGDMAAWREQQAQALPKNDPRAQRLLAQARELRLQEAAYLNRSRNAPQDGATGQIEHSDFPHLTPAEYNAFRTRIDAASPTEVWRVRYERYQLNKTKGGLSAEDFDSWLPKAQRAHANQLRGMADENAAIDAAGMQNNNYNVGRDGHSRTPVVYTTKIDGADVTVRPDAVSDTVWADIKSLSGEADVQYYTQQLQAEFKGALTDGKKLMVVLSSESPQVRPSAPLAKQDNVVVLRRNPQTGDWFTWTTPRFGEARWTPVGVDEVRALAGSGDINPAELGKE